jgi:serine/threonine protein kinase
VHAGGWLHCDVRPSNVVLAPDAGGDVVLVDWGLAVKKDSGGRMGVSGVESYIADDVLKVCQQPLGIWHAVEQHDLLAVAYTYAAVAAGDESCHTPWASAGRVPYRVIEQRSEWVAGPSEAAAVVRRFIAAVEAGGDAAYAFFDGE